MRDDGTLMFIGTVVLIAILAIGYIIFSPNSKTEMDECKDKYKVYSCSLKPDYSAFTLPKGTQI